MTTLKTLAKALNAINDSCNAHVDIRGRLTVSAPVRIDSSPVNVWAHSMTEMITGLHKGEKVVEIDSYGVFQRQVAGIKGAVMWVRWVAA